MLRKDFELALPPIRRRRRKRLGRRFARDVRAAAPLLAVVVEAVAAAGTIVVVERLATPGADAVYSPSTTSISSTSNVSAAPPGMPPGDPRSP